MSWITDEIAKRQSADTRKEAEALKKAKELIAAEAAIARLESYIRTENDHLPALIRMTDDVYKTDEGTFTTLNGKDVPKARIIFYPHKLVIPFCWNKGDTAHVEVCYQGNTKGYLIDYSQSCHHFTRVVNDPKPLAQTIVQSVVTGAVGSLLKLVRNL